MILNIRTATIDEPWMLARDQGNFHGRVIGAEKGTVARHG